MNALVWVVVLLVLGLTVMVLEVFLPSGGILGFLSITAIIAAIATAFLEQGPVAGMTVLAIATVVVPVVLSLAFRWFPATPLGRRVLPPPPDAGELLPDAPSRRRLHELVGRTGRAASEMLPWGVIDIDGMRIDAMSECGPIPEGAPVVAVAAQGRALVVSLATPTEPADRREPREALRSNPPEKAASDGGSGLSPTLEGFEFDRLDPPSA
jgi:membrane-bound ClpP family serine protease